MKRWVFLALLFRAATCQAEEVTEGGYIVIRGAVEGCEAWPDRILEVVRIEDSEPVELLGLPPLQLIGVSAAELTKMLRSVIESRTGRRPQTLRVEILGLEDEYLTLANEYLASLHYLSEGTCPNRSSRARGIRRDWQAPPNFNEEMRRAYRLDLYDRVM